MQFDFCFSHVLSTSCKQTSEKILEPKIIHSFSLKHSGMLQVQTRNMKKCYFLFFNQEVILWLPVVTKLSPSTSNWHFTAPLDQDKTLETVSRTCILSSHLPGCSVISRQILPKAEDEALDMHFTGWEKKNKATKEAAACLGRSKEEQSYMTFNVLNKFCISGLFQRGNWKEHWRLIINSKQSMNLKWDQTSHLSELE